jgi:alpha-L-rhamnosidase
MRIERLQTNHITDPLGFDLGDSPTFTWTVTDAVGHYPKRATLTVTTPDGTIETDVDNYGSLCTHVAMDLKPRTRYSWHVSAEDDTGDSATSEEAFFETGKMDEPWQGRWITCGADNPRHPIFVRTIDTGGGNVTCARLYACGLGLYEATIGGRHVSEERLCPGTHAYDRWLQVQTFDVTDLIEDGSRLAFMMGHGWYSGRFGFILTDKGYYGDDYRLIAELHLTYEDGHVEVIGTDTDWKVERSNIVFSNIYDGERVDDTLPEDAIVAADLLDPTEADAATARLSDRLSLPIVPQETFTPTLIHTPAGEVVFDLGQNIAGTFRLRGQWPRGAKVCVQVGEVLQDGNFYRDNLRTAEAAYEYVSDGHPQTLEPHFTYYGYRYAKVTVDGKAPADIAVGDFTGIALYSDFDTNRGRISCGNAKVNQLVSNARWSMRDNFVDTPTDCPQRDERMGWTGDANVFSKTALLLGDPYAFYTKYLKDTALEQAARDGMCPAVVPSFGCPMGNGNAVWGDVTCRIPWNMYEADGDPTILANHYEAMRGWVDWIERFDGDDHAYGQKDQFGDWLALDAPTPRERQGGTDASMIAYLSWFDSTRIVRKAAHILGKPHDEARYQALEDKIRSWIEAEYYTATGRSAVDTQTAYVLSLAYGFGNDAWSTKRLQKLLKDNGGKLKTGFVGTPLLCPALSEAGLNREAYDLLLGEDYPGWLFAVNLGATTIWERWNSLDDQGRITGIEMNSLNHYSYGSIVRWLFNYAAGLSAAEPGYSRARIEPRVDWRLGHIEAELDSAAGTYKVFWECTDEHTIKVRLTIPFGAEADVVLPYAPEDAYERLGGHTLVAGTYEVTYTATQALRRTPSADWTIDEILAVPAAANAVRPFVDGFDFSALTCDRTKTLRELQAEGFGQNEKMSTQALEAADAALRELTDQR